MDPAVLVVATPTSVPSPAPSPTPKPLTFVQMNELYGPCVYLPVLMYHHVQDPKAAKDNHQTSISVDIDIFRNQMKFLKDRGYRTASISELTAFFDNGASIPKKSVLITFDDGYEDFYFNAYPILRENSFTALMFLSTGLINNFGYLNWGEVSEMAGSGIAFGNHTWSHKSAVQKAEVIDNEISLADIQLTERGFNNTKIFAYPYGSVNGRTEVYLAKLGYGAAFTTRYGSTLCLKQRYELPRIRVGNRQLSSYGL